MTQLNFHPVLLGSSQWRVQGHNCHLFWLSVFYNRTSGLGKDLTPSPIPGSFSSLVPSNFFTQTGLTSSDGV